MRLLVLSDLHLEFRGYDQPGWICFDCGDKHRLGEWNHACSCHTGHCDICGKDTITVTTPDNCGGVSSGWNFQLPHSDEYDAVVLAGDIGSHTKGLEWAARSFLRQPIIYVAGNHEYYDAHLGLLDELRLKANALKIHFLERNTVEIDGVRVIGCTLWSGFDLHGGDMIEEYMAIARRSINDYRMIRTQGGKRLEPRDTLKLYRLSVRWLESELAKPFAGKTVVVTHFAPHRGCVAPQHQGSDVSPYFVTDLSRLMTQYEIAVWCHGHTHTNNDFIAEGGCRVISNQLGYPDDRTRTLDEITYDTGFRNDLVIEV